MLSNKNTNTDEYMSIVPTSAMLGDGVGNLMAYIAQTTQSVYANKLAFVDELDATVMEVRVFYICFLTFHTNTTRGLPTDFKFSFTRCLKRN